MREGDMILLLDYLLIYLYLHSFQSILIVKISHQRCIESVPYIYMYISSL